jgi:hypothetical protein
MRLANHRAAEQELTRPRAHLLVLDDAIGPARQAPRMCRGHWAPWCGRGRSAPPRVHLGADGHHSTGRLPWGGTLSH